MQNRYTSDSRYDREDMYDSGEVRQRSSYSDRYADEDLRNPAGEYRSQRYASQYSSGTSRPAGYNSASGYRSTGNSARSSAYTGRSSSSARQGYSRSYSSRYDERYDERPRYSERTQSSGRYSGGYDDSYGYRSSARPTASGRNTYARREAEDVRYGTGRAAESRYGAQDNYRRSQPQRSASGRSTQGGYNSYAQSEYRRTQSAPKQITKRPQPRREDYLPEAIRERNAELRKKRIVAGVIAGILLIAIIVIIAVLAGGSGNDRSMPGVSKESPTPGAEATATIEPAATLNIIGAADPAGAIATATATIAPTTAPDVIGNTNISMTGVLGSAGNGAATGGASAGLRSAKFRVAGDVMVTEEQLAWAKSITGNYDFTENFELITNSLAKADYTIVNIETTLGKYNNKAYSGYPCFNSPPEILWPLVNSGVDYANLANNHMLDRYFDGIKNTIKCVEYVGMDHSGGYPTQEARNTPKIIEVGGIKIGVVSYTHTTNGQEKVCSEDAVKFGVPYLYKADIEGDIAACRNAGAEVVMAVVHWGEEYTHEPDDTQLKYAKRIAAAGADLIIGNHSHNIQPMGYIDTVVNGMPKKVFTIFSIGNFLTSHTTKDSYYSIILEFTINEQAGGSFTVDNIGYVPTYCWIENEKVVIVPSGKYYNNPPAGMGNSEWQRMRATVDATNQMYGEFTMLEE